MKALSGKIVYVAVGLLIFGVTLAVMIASQGAFTQASDEKKPSKIEIEIPTIANMRHFSAEELAQLLKEVERRKDSLESETRRLMEFESRLATYRQDIDREKQAVLKIREEVEQRHAELRKAEREFAQRVLQVEQAEVAAIRRSASIYEAMEPARAAAALTALDTAQAAKLLAFIDEKRAARMLQEMPAEKAAKLMDDVKRVNVLPGDAR